MKSRKPDISESLDPRVIAGRVLADALSLNDWT